MGNATTLVFIDRCEFRNNSAASIGSVLYIAVEQASYLSASQKKETKALSITNSVFRNNPGDLWYLQLRQLNASFHNNTIQNTKNPIILALFDNAFIMTNTSVRNTSVYLYRLYTPSQSK